MWRDGGRLNLLEIKFTLSGIHRNYEDFEAFAKLPLSPFRAFLAGIRIIVAFGRKIIHHRVVPIGSKMRGDERAVFGNVSVDERMARRHAKRSQQ